MINKQELLTALKELGFVKTVNQRSSNKSIYDFKSVDKLVTKWEDIQGNVEDNKSLINKLETEINKIQVNGNSTTSGNTYFPSGWL